MGAKVGAFCTIWVSNENKIHAGLTQPVRDGFHVYFIEQKRRPVSGVGKYRWLRQYQYLAQPIRDGFHVYLVHLNTSDVLYAKNDMGASQTLKPSRGKAHARTRPGAMSVIYQRL
jgi:hypothetical protein